MLLLPGITRPFVGHVASRCYFPTGVGASTSTFMASSVQMMLGRTRRVKVEWPNAYCNANQGSSTVETTTGVGTLTLSGLSLHSLVSGKFFRCTFGGSSSTTIAAGATKISDWTDVEIEQGSLFEVRARITSTTGPCFGVTGPNYNTSLGDALEQTATDKTMTGTVNDGGFGGTCFPCRVLGWTTTPSVGIVGDSRATGVADTTVDSTGLTGELMRALNNQVPVLNLACPGEAAAQFATSAPLRKAMLQHVTHIAFCLGINDFEFQSQTSAQLKANAAIVSGWYPNKPFIVGTLSPVSNSTDSWATLANQTTSVNNATRVSYNTDGRALAVSGQEVVVDLASATESALNSGKWIVNGSANAFTSDGLHGNTAAMLLEKLGRGIISPYAVGLMPIS